VSHKKGKRGNWEIGGENRKGKEEVQMTDKGSGENARSRGGGRKWNWRHRIDERGRGDERQAGGGRGWEYSA